MSVIDAFKRFALEIDDLGRNVDVRAMSRALARGASVLRREIRRQIRTLDISSDGRRALSRGLYVQRHRPRPGRPVRVTLRFRVSRPTPAEIAAARREGRAVRPDWDPFFYHWIEYGTAERSTRKGYARGRVRPQPFVRPAIDRAEPIAYRVIQDELDRAIDEVIAETRRRMRR